MHRVALLAVVVIFPPSSSTIFFTSSLFLDSFPRVRIFMLVSGFSRGSETKWHISVKHRVPHTNSKHRDSIPHTQNNQHSLQGDESKQVWLMSGRKLPFSKGDDKAQHIQQAEWMEGWKRCICGYIICLHLVVVAFVKSASKLSTSDFAQPPSSSDDWTAWKVLPFQKEICICGAGESLSLKQQHSHMLQYILVLILQTVQSWKLAELCKPCNKQTGRQLRLHYFIVSTLMQWALQCRWIQGTVNIWKLICISKDDCY